MSGARVTAAPPSELGVRLAALALHLSRIAGEHKRSAKYHRRRLGETLDALAALERHAAAVGVDLSITGEAEEAQHGPHHASSSA